MEHVWILPPHMIRPPAPFSRFSFESFWIASATVLSVSFSLCFPLQVVDFLKNPEKYRALGARVVKGVLLCGPAGTGKTLLAKAVAGEADVPFFSISASEFVEIYGGMGASRVRKTFADCRKKAPCILFIDELDAIGRSRSMGQVGGYDQEREQVSVFLSFTSGLHACF